MGISPRMTLGIWPEKVVLEEVEDEEKVNEEEQEQEQYEWDGGWEEEAGVEVEEDTEEEEEGEETVEEAGVENLESLEGNNTQATTEESNDQDDDGIQRMNCVLMVTVCGVRRTCGATLLNNEGYIRKHLSTHSRPDIPRNISGCPFRSKEGKKCQSRSESADLLALHVLARHIHTQHFDNAWVCESCKYGYSREDALKRHVDNGCSGGKRGNAK